MRGLSTTLLRGQAAVAGSSTAWLPLPGKVQPWFAAKGCIHLRSSSSSSGTARSWILPQASDESCARIFLSNNSHAALRALPLLLTAANGG